MAAATRLAGVAIRTPLLESRLLSAHVGRRILVKAETLQVGGAFKFRGAYNRLVQLDAAARSRGVVAWSSGNHAQGIAWAAKLLSIPVSVVMPADAPSIKTRLTRELGAEIIAYDRASESREDIARQLCAERGATLVPSYDDPDIISGQGTVALEMIEQARDLGAEIEACLVPCGGGGLVAGCALGFEASGLGKICFAVEPAGHDDTGRSLRSGQLEQNMPGQRSFCDALLAPTPGELTFPINQRLLCGGITVTDEEVSTAIRYAADTFKLVVEPGGAVALAAILSGKGPAGDGPVAVILSGGNVDASLLADLLRPETAK